MDKRKKQHLNKDSIISLILIPIVSIVFGVFFCSLIDTTLVETIVISLLLTIATSFIEHNIRSQMSVDKLNENDAKIENKVGELKILSDILDNIHRIDHPYFKKWAYRKLENFIDINTEFFEGTNRTNPHAEDTFGIDGIKETEKYGNLKAISVVEDYWEDAFTKEYLKVQAELIDDKKVKIQRVFVTSRENVKKIIPVMEKQLGLGIEIYYIFKDNQFINKEWLAEDYLIQDDKLLVQIYCDSHKFNDSEKETEYITILPSAVNKKLERFHRILERAEKFDANSVIINDNEKRQEVESTQMV